MTHGRTHGDAGSDGILTVAPWTRLAAATGREEFGGKAVGLAGAIASGHAVPDGVVVGVSQVARWVDATPDAATLGALLDALGGTVAVRSSAVGEDGAGASFAGQYETVLDVADPGELVDAVRRCVASGRASHVADYAEHAHGGETSRVAVVVQRMLAPDVAGVAFSVDPVSGADHVVVEAVRGVADRLLAGEVTGERWAVTDDDAVVAPADGTTGAHGVLEAADAAAVASLCRAVAASTGGPVDIEWAREDRDLLLLQARPITAVPVQPTARPPRGRTYVREPRFPHPVDPLTASTWLPMHREALTRVFEEFGAPLAAFDERVFLGRVYSRAAPLIDTGRDRPPPPAPIMRALMTLHPRFRRRLDHAVAWDGQERITAVIEEYEQHGREATRSRTLELRRRDLSRLDDDDLLAHVDEVVAHVRATADQHFTLAFATSLVPTGRLGLFVEEHLGWSATEVIGLLQGYGGASVDPGTALESLAAALGPDGVAAVVADPPALLARPEATAYLEQHGHRVTTELGRATDAEDPRRLVAHLARVTATTSTVPTAGPRGVRRGRPDPREHAHELEERAAATLVARDRALVERFRDLLGLARRGRPYNDETELTTLDAIALVRYAAVEIGGRLHDRGRLADADDVFLLELRELGDLLRDPAAPLPDIERRRAEHRWAEANPAPDHLGPPPAPHPPVAAVPRRARETLGAILWAVDVLEGPGSARPAADARRPDAEGALRGTPGSPGTVTGPARIVRTEQDFDRIQRGDVVVCPTTVAAWSPVFTVIGGLVTEHGGPLSHPATLAREYGLPAVLAVTDATSLIEDGSEVTVDGGSGSVRVATD